MLHAQALRDMALFVEVAKRGSFSRAAAALDMPISSLSRRIMLFEEAVGLRLIERTTRKLTLTRHGETYLPRAARLVDEAQRTVDEMLAQASGPRVTLRIAVPTEPWILRAVSAAIAEAALPEHVRLTFDHATAGTADGIDLAIIIGEPSDPAHDTRILAKPEIGLYASRHYVERHGAPTDPHDLDRHQMILVGQGHGAEWRMQSGQETAIVRVAGRIACTSADLARQLAMDGLGIVAAAAIEVPDSALRGLLVRVLPAWRLPASPIGAAIARRTLPREADVFLDRMMSRIGDVAAGRSQT